jgi:hypothetical protein
LYREPSDGGKRSEFAARKIWYWHESEHVEVDDWRYLDLSELPTARSR